MDELDKEALDSKWFNEHYEEFDGIPKMCKITVFDYSDARHNSSATHYNKDNPPEVVEYNVEAYCIGGDEGVRAYWIQNNCMYSAHGDDGHWWLTSVISVHWLPEITKAMIALTN